MGSLVLKHPLDYEAVSTLPLTVSVQDSGGLSTTHSQVISVDDVNEPPTVLAFDKKKKFLKVADNHCKIKLVLMKVVFAKLFQTGSF